MKARIAYVNGRYMPYDQATVHIEDRGYQFADGVYEVMGIYKGRPFDLEGHWARLFNSLAAVHITPPFSPATLTFIAREVVRRNRISTGTLYIQVTRGVAPRNHYYPDDKTCPGVVVLARQGLGPGEQVCQRGVCLISQPDLRWKRCDIKSIGLLANVMAKQTAKSKGAFEAVLIDQADNTVTECGSSNIWIIDQAGRYVTRPLGSDVLPGVTRDRLAKLIKANGGELIERPFSLDEVKAAQEVFLSSTGSFCLSGVKVDETPISGGQPGPLVSALRQRYISYLDGLDGPKWSVA